MLTFRGGGWVILVSAVLTLAAVASKLGPHFLGGARFPGDGRHVESYGFDLSTCLIPRDQIIPAHPRKDMALALTHPPVMSGSDVEEFNRKVHGKYIVSGDRVIGVSINGESRAYPLQILNLHEIINDTLGGVPIALTYSPPCDGVVVFDRRVDGTTLEFGVSGLQYNANLIMYDRRENASDESLWLQLQVRAVAGPAAAQQRALRVLPSAVMRWADWFRAHPETTVLQRDRQFEEMYKGLSAEISRSLDSDELPRGLQFQKPLTGAGLDPKDRMIAIQSTEILWKIFSFKKLREQGDADGRVDVEVDGEVIQLRYHPPTPGADETVDIEFGDRLFDEQPGVVHTMWFAWLAQLRDAN